MLLCICQWRFRIYLSIWSAVVFPFFLLYFLPNYPYANAVCDWLRVSIEKVRDGVVTYSVVRSFNISSIVIIVDDGIVVDWI